MLDRFNEELAMKKSPVALERCKTAREAVMLMGQMIEQYGYYGTGETPLLADPNEGWVMEMCGYGLNGTGGVWVAQRVPDSDVFVAANLFRIRVIRKGDVVLVEGRSEISRIIQVLTQSSWSRSVFYVGDGPEDSEIEDLKKEMKNAEYTATRQKNQLKPQEALWRHFKNNSTVSRPSRQQ